MAIINMTEAEKMREACAKVAEQECAEQAELATLHRRERNYDSMDRRNAAVLSAARIVMGIRVIELPAPEPQGVTDEAQTASLALDDLIANPTYTEIPPWLRICLTGIRSALGQSQPRNVVGEET